MNLEEELEFKVKIGLKCKPGYITLINLVGLEVFCSVK
jgi:hypothetical protein